MPQLDYDPADPDELWDHVQTTIIDAVDPQDFESPQLYAAIAVRLLPELPRLQAVQLALQLFIQQHGDANEFLDDASIENAKDLLEDIEADPPPRAPGFAKNPPVVLGRRDD
jgi:hypothetical protein